MSQRRSYKRTDESINRLKQLIQKEKKGIRKKKDPYFKRPHLLDPSHEQQYTIQKKNMTRIKNLIDSRPYSQKMREIRNSMKFVRSFATKGVQGIVGFVKIDKDDSPIVFKTSVDINRSVEHEYKVLESLSDMRRYCPHFVRSIGMIELPVATDFISDSYNNSLLDENDETLPRSVMFMEYVNKLPFYKLCRDSHNKNIIISQILQVLIALEMAQVKKNFTHYDLHTSNVLVQMCEKNSIFVYRIGDKKYAIPTYGFFPLIIDTGISHAKCNEGEYMMSNTDNYDHGFQTTVYDRLNDVHHFLLATFYYIEVDSDGFDSLSNKLKIIFRHLPVMRKSGWKKLPNDLCDIIISSIKKDCRVYKKFEMFDEYDKASLEILNGLIKLPIKNHGESSKNFGECFTAFMEEYHSLVDIDDFSDYDILFVLRTIVDCINKYRDQYMSVRETSSIVESFRNEFKKLVSEVLPHNVNYDINYEKLLVSGIVFSERLETNYYEMIEENKSLIDRVYEKTLVKSPIDMVCYIGRNMTPHFNIDNETVVYYWDANTENCKKTNCRSLTRESINRINRCNFVDRGDIVVSELKL